MERIIHRREHVAKHDSNNRNMLRRLGTAACRLHRSCPMYRRVDEIVNQRAVVQERTGIVNPVVDTLYVRETTIR